VRDGKVRNARGRCRAWRSHRGSARGPVAPEDPQALRTTPTRLPGDGTRPLHRVRGDCREVVLSERDLGRTAGYDQEMHLACWIWWRECRANHPRAGEPGGNLILVSNDSSKEEHRTDERT